VVGRDSGKINERPGNVPENPAPAPPAPTGARLRARPPNVSPFCRPGGPTESSPRRKPWGAQGQPQGRSAPVGAAEGSRAWSVAPSGAGSVNPTSVPRLTPWAILCRRSAAPRTCWLLILAPMPPAPSSSEEGKHLPSSVCEEGNHFVSPSASRNTKINERPGNVTENTEAAPATTPETNPDDSHFSGVHARLPGPPHPARPGW